MVRFLILILILGSTFAGPVAAATCAVPSGAAATAEAILKAVNSARRNAGLSALTVAPDLTAAARLQACAMAASGRMSHTGPGGSTVATRAKAAGYCFRTLAENVGWNYRTGETLVAAWMQSDGHRANILNRDVRDTGFGIAVGANGPYYAMVLGRPC